MITALSIVSLIAVYACYKWYQADKAAKAILAAVLHGANELRKMVTNTDEHTEDKPE